MTTGQLERQLLFKKGKFRTAVAAVKACKDCRGCWPISQIDKL